MFTSKDDIDIEHLLRAELLKCSAPVTGYYVVSAIVTERGTYIGHNHEEVGSVVFEHAEIRVLEEILKCEEKPVIKKIFMLGGGVIKKVKYYTPCYACAHKLAPYVSIDATVTLFPLPRSTERVAFTVGELLESYSDAPYSKFKNTEKQKIRMELVEKTILNNIDVDFVADLILLGLEKEAEFYLTGSSTGRGGVSRLLMKKTNSSYGDIDMVVVVKKDCQKEIVENIEKIITLHYGKFSKEERVVPAHQNKLGVVLGKTYYKCGERGEKLIDFTFSTDFVGSLSYHAYEFKNWFHRLS
jgi:cytidine deaminase